MAKPTVVRRNRHKYICVRVFINANQYKRMKKHDANTGIGLSGIAREALYRYFQFWDATHKWAVRRARRKA